MNDLYFLFGSNVDSLQDNRRCHSDDRLGASALLEVKFSQRGTEPMHTVIKALISMLLITFVAVRLFEFGLHE